MKIKIFFIFSLFIILSFSFVHAAEDAAGSSVQIGLPEEEPPIVNPPSGGVGGGDNGILKEPPIETPSKGPEEIIYPPPEKELEPELQKPAEELTQPGITWDFLYALLLIILLLIILWLLLDKHNHNKHYHSNQNSTVAKDNVLKQENNPNNNKIAEVK